MVGRGGGVGVRESSNPLQYRTAEECLASESILSHSNDLPLLGSGGAECIQSYGFLVGHSVPSGFYQLHYL